MKTLTFLFVLFSFIPRLSVASSKLGFIEITVTDQSRAKSFYEKIFGWKFISQSPSFLIIEGAGIPAGMLEVGSEEHFPGKNIKLFFEVKSLEAKLDEVVGNGGKVVLLPFDVGTAWIAEFTDSEGNLMGMTCEKPCDLKRK